MKLLFSLILSLTLFSAVGQTGNMLMASMTELPLSDVSFELENKEGVVTISYKSELPQDLELLFLTKSGSVLWSKMLFGFSGKATEKLDYLVPEGTYLTRVLTGTNEVTKRIEFK